MDSADTNPCPNQYNEIALGCYKINNGTNMTWSAAQQNCLNDAKRLSPNVTEPNPVTHLIALELVTEKTALFYWMNAYSIKTEFWIDGIVSTSSWDWSNQSITWYFENYERAVIGNGSNYKIAFDSTVVYNTTITNNGTTTYNSSNGSYQIVDDIDKTQLHYICEYQKPCNNTTNTCKNNATCYLNVGREICICAPGFTGQYCETDINECLSSPCLHGGDCTNSINHYTCNCSNIFYTGSNCEINRTDPTENDRVTAFWSVVGVVAGLVVILALSDLPWGDIIKIIGCSGCRSKSCCKYYDGAKMTEKNLRLSDSPVNDQNIRVKNKSISDGTTPSNEFNYRVMDTVWNPEYIHDQKPSNPQYNGYFSPDQSRTPDNILIQSFAAVTMTKQQQKELEDKRIYAVNIDDSTNSTSKTKDPVNTMISWTEQLQEQLRNKKSRETSANSTKQLIPSLNTSDC
ncbi:unnamed protein product [Rotaria magnacalcarata]|uniref:EGF-like domain-containing protein n=1 Tax=Rotaria magnacalcarata TaxID=392030 RepID=A0A819Y5M3_9BILA|nr:unnamed protein product [Rotaria magnacalcarata]CAF2070457.1 unnamed protein product [Rotaria magnacalcarata]CAF4115963.1 unnamed protein product [Rotaria magnacalcarata]CAF4149890.1 unnamed protein product [Rotaria magnacalcarata]